MNDATVATLAAAGALFVLLRLLVRSLRRRRLSAATAAAEAEVLRVWRDGEGAFHVEYRFIPDGAAEVVGTAYAGCLQAGLPEPGERVMVRYDPRNPRVSGLAGEACAVDRRVA